MMFYLGIDIGKRTHAASIMSNTGEILLKGFSFKNNKEGGEQLLRHLNRFSTDPADFSIGMEATGHYWLTLFSFLDANQYIVHVINPIQTDGWRKGTEIRKRKNDIIDSVLIADLIRYGSFGESVLSDEPILELKQLARYRAYLKGTASDFKRKIIAIIDQLFPEYETVFPKSGIFGKASKQVLYELSSPEVIDALSTEELMQFLSKNSRGRLRLDKADKLKQAASNSFGITFAQDAYIFQLRSMLEQLMFLEKQVGAVDQQVKQRMEQLDSVILTVPGIGDVNGATILGEIGDINRFSTPKKLVAYAGLDASVTQSGEFEASHNVMSKRGSPYLRKALFSAALVASNHDPVLKAFYQKKRSEGKHHLTAIGAVSRKLCYIIHAVLKKNEVYKIQ